MEAAFTPTWRQALRHGLSLGGLVALVGVTGALLAGMVAPVPSVLWFVLAGSSLATGAAGGVLLGRRGTRIDARGIRTAAGHEPWDRVVDLRAERRGARTVVSVYLVSGASLQLAAPYSGDGPLAEDPQFELKVSALSHLWRSHRIGGVPC
ncbi:hypothetical protein [Actinoplanes sp. NBRC 103695]|uniref:hypothetical protein n=1 Tax=Actinoplanes sp. NBRC 103695 TaxID=3032202 RepID=UPI0025572A0A|nr:hypothetical protein [Actinoplanes sp. NBRC 103695]